MTGELTYQLTGGNTPQLNRMIVTPCHRIFAIWGKGKSADIVGMTRKDAHLFPSYSIPKTSSVISASRKHILAIRGINHTCEEAAMTAEYMQGLASGNIPDASRLILTAADDGLTVRRELHIPHFCSMS